MAAGTVHFAAPPEQGRSRPVVVVLEMVRVLESHTREVARTVGDVDVVVDRPSACEDCMAIVNQHQHMPASKSVGIKSLFGLPSCGFRMITRYVSSSAGEMAELKCSPWLWDDLVYFATTGLRSLCPGFR